MPAVDKPLEELLNYTGSSPRPRDFDDYWSVALKEMNAVTPDLQWCDTDFSASYAKCQSLYFTGTGGARVHAKVVTPIKATQAPSPALIFFHGYTIASPDWVEMLAYAAEGYTVVGMDCRGQGGLSEDTVPTKGNTVHGHIIKGLDDDDDKLYYRNVFLDTAQMAKIVMDFERVDPDRVSVAGLSQGGALALACASLEPRIYKTYSQYPFLCDYKRVWDMGLDQQAYTGLRDYFRRFDPLHKREDEIFNKLGYIDIVNLAPRIKSEVLMSLTLLDEICPPSTQFAAYNAIRSKKSHLIYPDFGHEDLPGAWDQAYQFLTDQSSE